MKEDVGNVDRKIEQARDQLKEVQSLIDGNIDLLKEKTTPAEMEKWSEVQEKILKQKSRDLWIKVGDGNNGYFFATMKARASVKHIADLIGKDGRKMIKKIQKSSKKLLTSTKASWVLLQTSSLLSIRQ